MYNTKTYTRECKPIVGSFTSKECLLLTYIVASHYAVVTTLMQYFIFQTIFNCDLYDVMMIVRILRTSLPNFIFENHSNKYQNFV